MMLNTTRKEVWQKYRALGLGNANLELMFAIPASLWVQNSGTFPDLGTGLWGSEQSSNISCSARAV